MNFLNQSGSVNYYPSTFSPQVLLFVLGLACTHNIMRPVFGVGIEDACNDMAAHCSGSHAVQ